MIYLGDCLDVMRGIGANSVDAIVTDPPYGLGFMGKEWDHGIPGIPFWQEALHVAKPGCHLLAFGGTRTFHRLACAIEDAGWEIRDTLMWVYGSGFPKSHDVSKAIDKAAGAKRRVIGKNTSIQFIEKGYEYHGDAKGSGYGCEKAFGFGCNITAPATDAARQWEGWGTALKPAWEPIILARKPLDGTVAQNVQKWGTGAINVDGCRVGIANGDYKGLGGGGVHGVGDKINNNVFGEYAARIDIDHAKGRWPANLLHDGSEEVLELFPETKSGSVRDEMTENILNPIALQASKDKHQFSLGDSGSAARFFYCAKASRAEREMGCEGMERKEWSLPGRAGLSGRERLDGCEAPLKGGGTSKNHHPTVKPLALMRYLCRLITPPNGIILDPFMGSGTTGMAAKEEGFHFIGIEKEAEYIEIAEKRIEATA